MRAAPIVLAISLAACAGSPTVDPTDAVKTEAEAIALGKKACGGDDTAERIIRYATLQDDGVWVVWGPANRRHQDAFLDVHINKRDGSIAEECSIRS
jgi:hypothetical protein